jgi:hypothetical protein
MSSVLRTASLAVALALGLSPAWANETAVKEKTPQQNRMAQCNQEAKAKTLKGDERKAFMKQCLSNKPVAAATADAPAGGQSTRAKACQEQAKGKRGEERKAFIAECLKA